MLSRSIGTALVLMVATAALGACSSSSGGGGGGGGDEFFGQTFGAAPNTNLATFLDDADAGEKLSITQHTGSMTLSDIDLEDAEDIIDFLFFNGDPPVPDGGTVDVTADASDGNPAHFELTDTDDNDFIFRIASTGDLEMFVENDDPMGDGFFEAETIDDDPAVGDDIAEVRLTFPGEPGGGFGPLDFMSVVAWVTIPEPAVEDTEGTVEFGLGHMGLATPVDDIPTTGTAEYSGDFVGIYVEPGTGEGGVVGVATGDAEFVADFAEATVEGGVFEIDLDLINLAGDDEFFEDVGDIVFEDVTIDGNTFAGAVVPDDFFGFDPDSEGTLDGVFYGPVIDGFDDTEGSAEAGVVLTLEDGDSDAFITGVIGATLDD